MDINSQDIYGQTELIKAIISDNIYLIESILKKEPDVNIQAYNGDCVLFLLLDKFIKDKDPKLIKLILPKITDINCIDYNGNTILHKLLALYKKSYTVIPSSKQPFKSPIVLKKEEEDYWLDKLIDTKVEYNYSVPDIDTELKCNTHLRNPTYDIREAPRIGINSEDNDDDWFELKKYIPHESIKMINIDSTWDEDNIPHESIKLININPTRVRDTFDIRGLPDVLPQEYDMTKMFNETFDELKNKRKEELSTYTCSYNNKENYNIEPSDVLDMSISNDIGRGTSNNSYNFNSDQSQFPYDTICPALFKSEPGNNIGENLEKRFFNEISDIKDRINILSDSIYEIISLIMENQNINFNMYNSENKNIYDLLCDIHCAKLFKLFSSYPNINANYLILNIVNQMDKTPNKELCAMFMQLVNDKNIDIDSVLKYAVNNNNVYVINKLLKDKKMDLTEYITIADQHNFLQCKELLNRFNFVTSVQLQEPIINHKPDYLFINGLL